MEDRGWDIEMVSSGNRCHGWIVDSRDPEVKFGAAVFRDLSGGPGEERFSGTMIRTDSGREVSVQLACVDEDTVGVTARIAFVRRSLVPPAPSGSRPGRVGPTTILIGGGVPHDRSTLPTSDAT
jgi:hypothetical protein